MESLQFHSGDHLDHLAGDGHTAEYHAATKAPMILRVIIIFPVVSLLVVGLRLFTRLRIVRLLAIDDWFILCAMVFSIGTSITMGFQVINGMGRHMDTLTAEMGVRSLQALWASIIIYLLGLTFTKLSILYQYLRIAVSKPLRMVCWILVGITIANGVQNFITAIFTCAPIHYFWDQKGNGRCMNRTMLWFTNAGINIAQDFALAIIPLFLIKGLMLPTRQKIVLYVILGLGGFAAITSILRLHSLYIISVSTDISWENPEVATWSCVELNIGIICASLPTLRALVSRLFPTIMPTKRPMRKYRFGSRKFTGQNGSGSDTSPAAKSKASESIHSGDIEHGFEDNAELKQIELEKRRLAQGSSAEQRPVETYCRAGTRSMLSTMSSPGLPRIEDGRKNDPFNIKVVTTTRQWVEYDSTDSLDKSPQKPEKAALH